MESLSNTDGSAWSYSHKDEDQNNNRVVDQGSNTIRTIIPKWECVSSDDDDDDIYVAYSDEMNSRENKIIKVGNSSLASSSSASSSFIFTEEDVLVTAMALEMEGSSTLISPPTSPTKQREINTRIVAAAPSSPDYDTSQNQNEFLASPPASSQLGSTKPLGMAALFSRHAATLSPSKSPAKPRTKNEETTALLGDDLKAVTRNQTQSNSHAVLKEQNDQFHIMHDNLAPSPPSSPVANRGGKVALLSQFYDRLAASPKTLPHTSIVADSKISDKALMLTPIRTDSRASRSSSSSSPSRSPTLVFNNRRSYQSPPDTQEDNNGHLDSTVIGGLQNQMLSINQNESVWKSALSQPSISLASERSGSNLGTSLRRVHAPLEVDQMEVQETFVDEEDPSKILVPALSLPQPAIPHHPNRTDKLSSKKDMVKNHDEETTLPLVEDDSISKTIPSFVVRGRETGDILLGRCWKRHGLACVVFLLFVVVVVLVVYIVDKYRPINFGRKNGVDEGHRDEVKAPTMPDFHPPPSYAPPYSPSAATGTPSEPSILSSTDETMYPTSDSPYSFNQLVWTQMVGDEEIDSSLGRDGNENDQTLLLGGSRSGSRFGSSLAMSANGKVVAVGGPGSRQDQVGYVQVMEWDETDLRWVARGRPLSSPSRFRDGFGVSVDLNDDGTIVAIAAVGHTPSVSSSINIVPVGCAFVFEYLPNRFDWSPLGTLEEGMVGNSCSGRTIKLSSDGTTLAFAGSSPGIDLKESSTIRNYVRVYRLDTNKMDWIQLGADLTDDEHLDLHIGHALDMSEDGIQLIIGSTNSGGTTGAIHIFRLVGAEADDSDSGNDNNEGDWEHARVIYGGGQVGDSFGSAVSISADGKFLAGTSATDWTRIFENNSTRFGLELWGQLGNDITTPMLTMVTTKTPPVLFDSSVSVAYDRNSDSVVVTVGNVFHDTFQAMISPSVVSTYYFDRSRLPPTTQDPLLPDDDIMTSTAGVSSWELAMAEIGGLGDGFGTTTALSKNGLEVAIGVPNFDNVDGISTNPINQHRNAGRVVVFQGRKRGII